MLKLGKLIFLSIHELEEHEDKAFAVGLKGGYAMGNLEAHQEMWRELNEQDTPLLERQISEIVRKSELGRDNEGYI